MGTTYQVHGLQRVQARLSLETKFWAETKEIRWQKIVPTRSSVSELPPSS